MTTPDARAQEEREALAELAKETWIATQDGKHWLAVADAVLTRFLAPLRKEVAWLKNTVEDQRAALAILGEENAALRAQLVASEEGRALAEALVISHEGHIKTMAGKLAGAERVIANMLPYIHHAPFCRKTPETTNYCAACTFKHRLTPTPTRGDGAKEGM